MKIAFLIDEGAGPYTVIVSPAAMVAWEGAHNRSVADLATGVGMTQMTDLVWRQRVIDGYTGDLDTFRASLADIDPVGSSDPT